jgi:hypothetical protein
MFNLEQSIAEWRRRMIAGGIKSPVPLDELESHLREEIDGQVRAGHEVQQAFEIAVTRLGPARILRKEFGKVGEVMSSRQRKFNVVFCSMIAILCGLAGIACLFPMGRTPSAFRERMLEGCAFLSFAVILYSWRIGYRLLPVLPGKWIRIAVAFVSMVASVVCTVTLANFIAGSASALAPFEVTCLWSSLPTVIAAAFIFGLEEAAYRNTTAFGS